MGAHLHSGSYHFEVGVDSVYPDSSGPFMVPVGEVGQVVPLPVSMGVPWCQPTILQSPLVQKLLHTGSSLCSVVGGFEEAPCGGSGGGLCGVEVSSQDDPGAVFLMKHGISRSGCGYGFLEAVGEVGCDQPHYLFLPGHLYL